MNQNEIILGFNNALVKEAQPAKGIPDRDTKTPPPSIDRWDDPDEFFDFVLQDHDADQAGKHQDLRLARKGDNRDTSWAIPKGIPAPGKKRLAIQQPDHSIDYHGFEGEIEDGYGSGRVETNKQTEAEVLESKEDKVRFNLYDEQTPKEFVLTKLDSDRDDNWLIINTTPTRESEDIPSDKPDMDEVKVPPNDSNSEQPEEVKELLYDREHVMEEKLDGSHNIIKLKPGENPRVFSYRDAKNETGLIDHTWQMLGLKDKKAPENMPEVTLRAELWGKSKTGDEPLSVNEVGGILNSKVKKSRKKQRDIGELRASVIDIAKEDGQDMSDAGYADKHEKIKKYVKQIPGLEMPRSAWDSTEKQSLYDEIKRGKNNRTQEGVIFKRKSDGNPDKRVKFNPEFDVVISGILPASEGSKYDGSHAGAIQYKWPGDQESVGNIGTGFSDELRKAMWENPDDYIGKTIKVRAHEVHDKKPGQNTKRGALRMPVFKAFHPDKNDELPDVAE